MVRARAGGAFEWIELYHLQPCGAAAGQLAVVAAVEAAPRASVVMVETASAVVGGGGQQPVVLCLGRWPVASAVEMAAVEAASAKAKTAALMELAAAAAVMTRRSHQCSLVGGPAWPFPSARVHFPSARLQLSAVGPLSQVCSHSSSFLLLQRLYVVPCMGGQRILKVPSCRESPGT